MGPGGARGFCIKGAKGYCPFCCPLLRLMSDSGVGGLWRIPRRMWSGVPWTGRCPRGRFAPRYVPLRTSGSSLTCKEGELPCAARKCRIRLD